MKYTSLLIEPEPVRQVTFELPETKAKVLAEVINDDITWSDTPVEDELCALYDALMGLRTASS